MLAGRNILLRYNTIRGKTVHHAENSTSLLGLRDQHLRGIGAGAKNATDFRHVLNRFEHIDRENILHKNNETVSGGKTKGVRLRQLDKLVICAGVANQTGTGGFTERDSEFDSRYCVDHRLIYIFNRLNKM